jgi:hypothetical protein
MRCQACKTRLVAGYITTGIAVIATIAVTLLLIGWLTH